MMNALNIQHSKECGRKSHLNSRLKKSSSGFTMIELLIVTVLIAILGATAFPQFLDFRNEAKLAVLNSNLSAMRVGIQNQRQQAMLRCGASMASGELKTRHGNSFLLFVGSLLRNQNDITFMRSGIPSLQICTTADVLNPADRKFFDISSKDTAKEYILGVERPAGTALPKNPFIVEASAGNRIYAATVNTNLSDINYTSSGGRCGWVDLNAAAGLHSHWWFVSSTGDFEDVFPGTNTDGIHECNF